MPSKDVQTVVASCVDCGLWMTTSAKISNWSHFGNDEAKARDEALSVVVSVATDDLFTGLQLVSRQLHACFALVMVRLADFTLQAVEGDALDRVVLGVTTAGAHRNSLFDHFAVDLDLAVDWVTSVKERRTQIVIHVLELNGPHAHRVRILEPETDLFQRWHLFHFVLGDFSFRGPLKRHSVTDAPNG